MRILRHVVALVAVCAASAATAQTDTPTATPTNTPTITPTLSRHLALALQDTCASTPCTLTALPSGPGVKTIAVETTTGTATIVPYCRVSPGHMPAEFALGSFTGATCTTMANCAVTTTAWCDEIYLVITACGSSCRVNGWLRIDD